MHFLFIFVLFLIIERVTSLPVPMESTTKTSNEIGSSGADEANGAEIRKSFLAHTTRLTDKDLVQIREKLKMLNVNVRRSFDPADVPDIKPPDRKAVRYENGADSFKDVWELNQKIADYLYQSDILLTPEQMDDILVGNSRQKRKAKADPAYKWPLTRPIPYVFDKHLAPIKRVAIENAIKFWQDHTCVRFEYNADGYEYDASLKFINGAGCFAMIGRIAGQQLVSIGDGCESLGLVSHEIGHALGFYHEQSRYDRDDFLWVNMTNIRPNMAFNFYKSSPSDVNFYGIPYEYGSIMSYASNSFAIERNVPVIIPRDPFFLQSMGQRTGPTFLDVLEMNRHYGCLATCKDSTTKCGRGGYPNPKDCSKCICPMGFGGDLCNERQPSQNADGCGGYLQAYDTWQSLFWAIGGTRTIYPSICSWHIIAASNERIELQITGLNANCNPGCAYNALQVKTRRNFQPTGYRHCCKEDNLFHVYKSDTNIMPIIAEAYFYMNFTFEFRSIPQLHG